VKTTGKWKEKTATKGAKDLKTSGKDFLAACDNLAITGKAEGLENALLVPIAPDNSQGS
jgi:hypothetical protein